MGDRNATTDGLEQLLSLEEKISQTIDLLRSIRSEKEELLRQNAALRRECDQQSENIQTLEGRVGRLEEERDSVRGRIQKLLDQVDSLTRERPEA